MIWEIIGGILLSLLATEIYDSFPRLTNLLLRFASHHIPTECRARYWEEWMGELDAQGDLGKLRKLGWALWVLLSSWKTGRTLHGAIEQTKRLALARQREPVTQQVHEDAEELGLEGEENVRAFLSHSGQIDLFDEYWEELEKAGRVRGEIPSQSRARKEQ